MQRYLIETPHTADNCLALVDEVDAQGYLQNFEWGCRAGVHNGWAIIEAADDAEARLAVPSLVRDKAHVIRLNKFTREELVRMHAQ